MAYFGSIFGRSKDGDASRFITETAFRENLAKQTMMSPMTVAQLNKLGVTDSTSLKLEFFFYTDTEGKAQSLTEALRRLHYDVRRMEPENDSPTYLVTGWSTRINMDANTVVSWTEEMCHLGFAHDADFDGWGTSPE